MSTSGSANYVLLTRLADKFAARYRAGERPSLQEYMDRHPELADDIHELFPAMVEMVNHYVRGTCRPALASAVPVRIRGQHGGLRIARGAGRAQGRRPDRRGRGTLRREVDHRSRPRGPDRGGQAMALKGGVK